MTKEDNKNQELENLKQTILNASNHYLQKGKLATVKALNHAANSISNANSSAKQKTVYLSIYLKNSHHYLTKLDTKKDKDLHGWYKNHLILHKVNRSNYLFSQELRFKDIDGNTVVLNARQVSDVEAEAM